MRAHPAGDAACPLPSGAPWSSKPCRGAEKLWFDYEPSAVHWASYAGSNFTDRQRVKRKAARWAENHKALPSGERLAVLVALLETETRGLAEPYAFASPS